MRTWTTTQGYVITRVLFGRSNVFLVSNGTSSLLVDTGWSREGKKLLKRLEHTGRPDAVIITHTHFDHAGSAGRVMERFAPKFIVQSLEKDFLESGDSPVPNGTMFLTRFLYNLGAERMPQWFHVQGVRAGDVFSENYDLSAFGFNAYVLHTPGHSAGSSSIIIGNETALVGDTLTGTPGSLMSPWGDDPEEMIRSWKKLLDTGCHTFHPSHGIAVSRSRLEKEYREKSRQFTLK